MSVQDTALPVSSSQEPQLEENQQRLYHEVLLILAENRLPCAVSGALALHHHTGIGRATKDLDIFLTAEAASAAMDLLSREGFECEVRDPIWLAKVHRDGYFVDFITGMSNAALCVTDSWIARAKPAVVLGVQTYIIAAEELLASKLFVARRERFDGADIAHIIFATAGNLDWKRILELAGQHWEVLLWSLILYQYVYPAYRSYVPLLVWTELINSLLSRLTHRDPTARFRGSLVDDNMFAIDVDEWGMEDLLSEYRACRAKKIEWHEHKTDPAEDGPDDATR